MKVQHGFIPNILTILNMFAGFLAIHQIFLSHYITAINLIIAAAIFDALDGRVARWLQQQSRFGAEFDSLADIISFCAAPALLVNSLYVSDLGVIGGVISFFPLLFGGVRLARFNLTADGEKKSYYLGMPVPVNALMIGSFIWFHQIFFGTYGDSKIALPLVIIMAFLMVSPIRFSVRLTFFFRAGLFRTGRRIFFGLILVTVFIFRGYVLFPIMSAFIVSQLLAWMVGYEEPRVHLYLRKRSK